MRVITRGVTRDCIIYERNVSLSIISKLRDEFRIIFPFFVFFKLFFCGCGTDSPSFFLLPHPIRIMNEIKVRHESGMFLMFNNLKSRLELHHYIHEKKLKYGERLVAEDLDCLEHCPEYCIIKRIKSFLFYISNLL